MSLLCIGLVSACATPEPQQAPRKVTGSPKTTKAAPAQADASANAGVPRAPQAPVKPAAPSTEELVQFIARAGDPSGPFTEADRQLLAAIPPKPASGSVSEAALALGVVRSVYNPATAQPATFVESDLGNGLTANKAADAAAEARNALESEAAAANLDLPLALEQNQFLQSENIYQMTLAALGTQTTHEGNAFAERIKGAMAQRIRAWAKFGDSSGLVPRDVPPSIPTPVVVPPPTPPQPAAEQPVAATPPTPTSTAGSAAPQGDVRDAAGLLDEAQALADKGDFDAAIAQVGRVAADSPQYAAAQEKLKQFSNKAVHALRTKAAQAYTSAAPVNDPRTRASYLERAKTYLQEALSKYPAADQLATVRDNLAVITRDLSKLSQDGGSSGSHQEGSAP